MKSFLLFAVLLLLAAGVATYVRYGTFDPCDWMEQDLAKQSGLPRLVVKARIQAKFLMDGISEPDLRQCTLAWWEARAEDLPDGS
jgi:hypothetical protein